MVRAFTAVVLPLLLAGCASSPAGESPPPGSADDPVRARFIGRVAYDTCGKVALGQGETVARTSAEWACLTAARTARAGAELAISTPTTEGDPIVNYVRVNPDGTSKVFIDPTADKFGGGQGWMFSTCAKDFTTCGPGLFG